jgi:N-acetylmuramoyl-L-alanine amidase
LSGLRVALEPGHGSSENLGAVGATGVPEKDVNRWTVDALKAELERVGAQVVVVRNGDENPNLRERARRVTASDAQLFVSVHANASDTSGGYLRSRGTATFYKHAMGRDLAAAVQRRLLAGTGLDDLGLVGSFNYAPIRLVTWMPAVLVEQAFLSNPAEEAQLLDPAFRARIAQSIRMGLEDFLRAP